MSEEAQVRYGVASRFYAVRRFDDAAREFQSAYALSGRPELLFNIGRAFEDGGHPDQAVAAYEHFLREGAPSVERASLDAHLAAVRAQLAERARAASAPSPAARPLDRACVAPSAPPSRVLPLSLLIGGGAALAGALVLGATVASTNASLARACPNNACATDHDAEAASGRARAVATDVLGGVGLAALVAGTVVWFTQARERPSRAPQVSFGCAPSGCGAAAEVTF